MGNEINNYSSDHWSSWACQEVNRKLHQQDPRQYQNNRSIEDHFQTQQVHFLRGLLSSVLNKYARERMVLGGDLSCVMNEIDKCGGRSFEQKKTVIQEMKPLMRTHNLIDTWSCKHPNKQAFTWNNPSKKICCRLDYLFISKSMEFAIQNTKIVPNIFSDHSAITLLMSLESNETKHDPGFWKFNNSLLTDKCYTEMMTKQIPES